MTLSIAISVVGLAIAIGGFAATYFGFVIRLMERDEKLARELGATNENVATLMTESKVYWEIIAPKLRDIIHSPNHQTRDRLVDELLAGEIKTIGDATLLECELLNMLDESEDPGEVVAIGSFIAQARVLKMKLEKDKDDRSFFHR